jgi:hypothetical protein
MSYFRGIYAVNIEPEYLETQTLSFLQFLNVSIAATKQRLLKMPLKKSSFVLLTHTVMLGET